MEENEINKILKPGKFLFIITIIAVIITLALFGAGYYLEYDKTTNPKDLGELIENYQDKDGEYAKIDIGTIPYGFAEEDNSRYYYFAMDKNNFMYIIRITDSTYKKLEEMYNNGEGTVDYQLKGYLFSIPNNLKSIAIKAGNEAFEKDILTYSNFEDYVGTVYIDETQKPEGNITETLYIFGIFIGVFTTFLVIASISQYIKMKKFTGNTELVEEIRNELAGLTDNTYKKQKVYLTNKYIISKTGAIEIFEYKDIIWEYCQTRYVNGVAQGKSLVLCTRDKKRHGIAATGPNDASIDEIMMEISDKNENVRIGFTKENRQFFKEFQKEVI